MSNTILIPAEEMKARLNHILVQHGFTPEKATLCADVFTANSVDGVYTHGINRFPRFVDYIKKGFVQPGATPSLKNSFGGLEQWNGNSGPGPLNAIAATHRVTELARQYGIGCVALSNTNHWMRGGYYGWQAAKEGVVFIGWTNTIANMPAWNALDSRLGNNPLVIAIPYEDEAIVLDMAMSQFSFGSLELSVMKGEELPVWGGYTTEGSLTKDPAAIVASQRPVPVGYWKGAGLALLLDLLATILSAGLATHQISKQEAEYGVSQVFVAIDVYKLGNESSITAAIRNIIQDYHHSIPISSDKEVRYPGERVIATRKNNLANGIPVLKQVWEEIGQL